MNPLKTMIIDDDHHARESLVALTGLYCPQLRIIAQAGAIGEGIQLINEREPSLVFLYTEIGSNEGFDLLDRLSGIDFQLIFTCACEKFAHKAFQYHAIDYLLKPVRPPRLIAAVDKAGRWNSGRQLQQQINHSYPPSGQIAKIIIPTLEGLNFVEVGRIVHVAGSGGYSTFHQDNEEKVMASKNLKYYAGLLPPARFFRAHQSHLINMDYIRKIIGRDGHTIELKDGSRVPLARRRKEQLIAILQTKAIGWG